MKQLFIFLFQFSFVLLNSTIINVPASQPTIQAGIDVATNTDTILVQPGTYVENINYNGKNITVASLFLTTQDTTYISQTIIDGDSLDSVVRFENGEDLAAVLCGFTIINGLGGVTPPDYYAGGITCSESSSPSIQSVTITGNSADRGGGIMCYYHSNPSLENVTISGNSADSGGGIYCRFFSSPNLENVTIIGNSADVGGGVYCNYLSNPNLENVTISGNSASSIGGGMYCNDSSPSFDPVNRCNLFLNYAGSSGCDLAVYNCNTIDVIVDTFTVIQPDDFFAFPIDNFTFDILNYKVEQVDQDLYVSPVGSNDNSGLTTADPLLTISYALAKVIPDSTNPHTIYLSNGTYSPSLIGEVYPLNCRSYVSLFGEDEVSTILDGEGLSGIIICDNDNNFSIENMTIRNGSASYGGGIHCNNDSNPNLENVTLSGNSASSNGGGICCWYNSIPNLENVTISGNSAGTGGGGILCSSSSPNLENVTINDNSAKYGGGAYFNYESNSSLDNVTVTSNSADLGGGIYCNYSNPSLQNVTITGNSADLGGGVYCIYDSNPSFSVDNRCNIYSNSTGISRGFGTEFFAEECDEIQVIVDTFTVMTPTDYYASPIDNFTFDLLHSIVDSLINADIYVATDGDDSNSGISSDDPFKTITHAMQIIYSDSLNIHTIFLAPGVYSPSTNGETFPIHCSNYVNLLGSGEDETILDAEGTSGVLKLNYVADIIVSNMTITNGYDSQGGGIACYNNSSPSIQNITITGNTAESYGGGLYCIDSELSLENISIYGNISEGGAGGILCSNSEMSLNNITISGNIAENSGGGVSCFNSSNLSMQNVSITGNTAETYGGGIYSYNSDPDLVNVTISGNSVLDVDGVGGGMYCRRDSHPSLTNCILWNDLPEEIYFRDTQTSNSITISYSDIQGGEAGIVTNNNGIVNWQEGNIDGDPLFVDPLLGDFHLTVYSPCIDAGDPVFPLDPDNTICDMGAYYYHQDQYIIVEEIYPEPGSLTISEGDSINFYIYAIDPDGNPIEYSWELDNEVVSTDSGYIFLTDENSAGEYTVTLSITDNYQSLPRNELNFEWNIVVEDVVNLHELLPMVTKIYQNYPNPFNPTTTINYSLKENSKISLNVYNIKGQKVRQLVSGQLAAGHHFVVWSGDDDNSKPVSSGVYFYNLVVNGKTEAIKKCLLIK